MHHPAASQYEISEDGAVRSLALHRIKARAEHKKKVEEASLVQALQDVIKSHKDELLGDSSSEEDPSEEDIDADEESQREDVEFKRKTKRRARRSANLLEEERLLQ